MTAVRQFDLGGEKIVLGDRTDIVKSLRHIPVGREPLVRLFRHGEHPIRLQDVEIGDFDIPDDVLNRCRLFEPGDIRRNAAGVIIRRDPAAGKEGLSDLDVPVVVFLGPGLVGAGRNLDRSDRLRQDDGVSRRGYGRVLIETGETVGGAEPGQESRESLLALRLRSPHPFPRRMDQDALFQSQVDAFGKRQGFDPLRGIDRDSRCRNQNHDGYAEKRRLGAHFLHPH